MPVADEVDLVDTYVAGMTAGGLTSVGGATAIALDELELSTRRHIILFSDGMQNVNPMLADTASGAIQILQVDPADVGDHTLVPSVHGDSGVPGKPGEDLDSFGTHIHTIGVGVSSSPWSDLMDEVAIQTDGTHFETPAPEVDLQNYFISDLLESFKGASPQLLRHQHTSFGPDTGVLKDSCWVNSTASRLTVALTWQGDADENQLACALEAPDGTLLEIERRSRTSPRRRVVTVPLPTYHRGRLVPAVGRWRLHVTGTVKHEVACQIFWIADDHVLKLDIDWHPGHYRVGDTITLDARLLKGDRAMPMTTIRQAKVRVTAPSVDIPRFVERYPMSAAKLRAAKRRLQWPGSLTDPAVKLEAMRRDKTAMARLAKRSRKLVTLEPKRRTMAGDYTFTKPGVHQFEVDLIAVDRARERIVRTTRGSVYVRP